MEKIGNWKLEIGNLEKEILAVINYFFFFNYPPTSDEIYIFLKTKVSKGKLEGVLEKMVKHGVIRSWKEGHGCGSRLRGWKWNKEDRLNIQTPTSISNNHTSLKTHLQHSYFHNGLTRYTLPEYSINKSQISKLKTQNYINRHKISQGKIKKVQLYIKLLSFFPQIKLVGLSGTVAMMNAKDNDDIDLFIITAKNRLFTGRLIASLLAQILGIRRQRLTKLKRPYQLGQRDKVCLNLFFDNSDMEVPDFKKTKYVAHEILQMKPLAVKGDIYERFLSANRWVFGIFPNAKSNIKNQRSKLQLKNQNFRFLFVILHFAFCILILINDILEKVLRNVQLYLIKRHQTNEIITVSQLWFHPDDFSKKI